jgi:hypothetical protein
MDVQETDDSNAAVAETAATAVAVEDKEKTDPVSVDGKLIRLAGPVSQLMPKKNRHRHTMRTRIL